MSLKYQPCYCEENVWHLAHARSGGDVLFVSNPTRSVAMWKQKAGDPVVWDYHVIYLDDGIVQDLDTTLGPEVPLQVWLDGTFPYQMPEQYMPRFRVVSRDRFIEVFASDRSHMQNEAGEWQALPPDWPSIGNGMNLMRFVDVEQSFEGRILDLPGLRALA